MKVMKFTWPAAVAAYFCLTSFANATILLSDTFSDGSRAETNLPNESAVYVSSAADVTTAVGSVSYTQSTSSRRLHTHFAAAGSPVSLNVGDRLIAEADFYARDGLGTSTSRNFRVGLFNDPDGTQVTADGYNDAGGAGNPWANAEGYAAFFPLSSSPGTTELFQIQKRTATDGSVTSLLGSGGAFTAAPSGGGVVTAALDNLYTLGIELHRESATQMNITYSLSDSSGLLATQTVVDSMNGGGDDPSDLGAGAPYTAFDTLAFRFSAANGSADRLEFTRFHVELNVIPEPATLALFGLSAMACVLRRQR